VTTRSSGWASNPLAAHGDLGPHNTVYRDGTPVAFIDWDGARPNEPLIELLATGVVAGFFGHIARELDSLAAHEDELRDALAAEA
jgi:aminoglycoside phosphotransferase (APT) family kinase protein